MKINFRQLKINNIQINSLISNIKNYFDSGLYINEVINRDFEKEIAKRYKSKYAIGVSSGTMALYLAIKALELGENDEIITTPLSWIATLNSITTSGCKPIFVDVKSDFNINSDLIESKITENTKAIMPVNFMGKMCDLDDIYKIANKYNIYVIEDGAQSFGSDRFINKVKCKKIIKTVSFNPMKILSSFGEAGALIVNEEKIDKKLRELRYLGTNINGECKYSSLNGKLDSFKALMIKENLNYFEKVKAKYTRNAKYYNSNLTDKVIRPENEGFGHNYHLYTILTKKRNALMSHLQNAKIDSRIVCKKLMITHKRYKHEYKNNYPVAERLTKEMLSLPNADHISKDKARYIVKVINKYFK